MNCLAFEKIVLELATGDVALDAITRQDGTAHAQSCVGCKTRLKTEQALSRSLRAVAAGDQSLSAPPTLEASLLAAFRAQAEPVPLTTNVIVPTFHESWLQRFFSQWKWAFAPVAVVVAVALVTVALVRARQPSAPPQPLVAKENSSPVPVASVAERIELPEPPARDAVVAVKETAPRPQVKAVPTRFASNRRAGRVTVDVGRFELDEPETISAQDFLVFDYARNLPPADSVQLMRVRLPRERLAPLGIPLPRETRNEHFVNADFLVGSDGVPRAIRVANR